MSKKNTIIEINGKQYNALTGAAMSGTPATPVKKPTMHDVVRHTGRNASGHSPKTSATLMRHAVKKPAALPKNRIKPSAVHAAAKRPLAEVVVSQSVTGLDERRLQTAGRIPKSKSISHFTALPMANVSQLIQPVAPMPVRPPAPATRRSARPKTTADVLEQALQSATSHQQKPLKKPRQQHSRLRVSVGTVVVLLVAGVVGSQQLPNLRLHMASAKAGFNASLPDYQPAGYSLGQLSYSQGVVASRFNSNSDSRAYTLLQKKSTWDSQALRDNFVAPADKNYQTVESAGRTIYLYGEHNASWVNGDIWYQIQSNGSLSNQQLVKLASSL